MKLGWLLAPTLDAPVLVFAERDQARAEVARADLALAQARVLAMMKSGATRDPKRRGRYAESIKQLRRAHRTLVTHALGYTWPGAADERGRPAVWMFQ